MNKHRKEKCRENSEHILRYYRWGSGKTLILDKCLEKEIIE
jgi:hypothetical protein